MKRSILILLVGIIGVALIILFSSKPPTVNEPPATPKSLHTNTPTISELTNSSSNEILTQMPPPTVVQMSPKKALDVAQAQNLADWTNAIPNIKQWNYFRGGSSWVADQSDTNNYPTMLLTGVNGNTLQYTAKLVGVTATNDHVQEIELQTPYMNIDETREFGLKLCDFLNLDSKDFLAWCDKVGNQWVDAPLYSNGNRIYGFGVHRTFNNEKPWYINFVIDRSR